jgi:hypothetical protein
MGSGLLFSRRKKAATGLDRGLRRCCWDGCGSHKLTSIATEAGGELWSPDGKNILFTSDVYPECDGDSQTKLPATRRKFKEVKEFQGQGADFRLICFIAIGMHTRRQAHPYSRSE